MYSVFFISSMALVSRFPRNYLTTYLNGQGFSGVTISLISLITLAIGNDPQQSGLMYFCVGVVLLFITMFLLWYSKFSRTYVYYVGKSLEDTKPGLSSFSEILGSLKNIWPSVVIFNIMVGTLFFVHPTVTTLVTSENYGHGNLWNGKLKTLILDM